jgi:hypothetical protein
VIHLLQVRRWTHCLVTYFGGTQNPQHSLHVRQGLPPGRLDGRERIASDLRLRLDNTLRSCCLDHDDVESVTHDVVQLSRHARALIRHRFTRSHVLVTLKPFGALARGLRLLTADADVGAQEPAHSPGTAGDDHVDQLKSSWVVAKYPASAAVAIAAARIARRLSVKDAAP